MPRKSSAKHNATQRLAIANARQTLQSLLGVYPCEPAKVREDVEMIYGPLSDDTWYRWQIKVGAKSDAPMGPNVLSTVTRHLLRCNAIRLAGNRPGCAGKKLRCTALAHIAIAMSEVAIDEWMAEFGHIPEAMTPTELEERIRRQSLQDYSPRHMRRLGIHRRKPVYRKPEILEILHKANCA